MKLGNVSFGLGSLSVVNSGAKVVANVAPQLIALSTKGGFAITPAVSKALVLSTGDNIMFVNNLAWAENAIATRDEEVVKIAEENTLTLIMRLMLRLCSMLLLVGLLVRLMLRRLRLVLQL